MTSFELQQQDPEKLAAGYTTKFRVLEILSIVAFWALSALLLWRVSPYMDTHGGILIAAGVAGFVLADLVSGLVHWLADTWGSTDMPVIGQTLLRPFREHHVDPKAMTRHDYVETNGTNCMITLPVATLTLLVPLDIEGFVGPALFFAMSMGSMIFWVMMTNQIHKWAHLDAERTPAILRVLQRLHLILPPTHHQKHHTAPFATYYCITTGWLNWPLAKVRFFRGMERVIMAVTGAIPRKDDIGLAAAIKIAPALDRKVLDSSTAHAARSQ